MNEGCLNCGKGCLNGPILDSCVKWNGPDINCVNIKKGEYYESAIVKMANSLCEILNEDVELKCLYNTSCESCKKRVSVPKAVEVLIDTICNLSTDQISYTGDRFCIGSESITSEGAKLMGRSLKYNVTQAGLNSSVYYDLNEATRGLPAGYQVSSARTLITSKANGKGNVILDSNSMSTSAQVSSDKYPITVDFDINVRTPSGGTTKLVRQMALNSATNGDRFLNLDVKDLSYADIDGGHTQFLEQVAAQVCQNRSDLEQFKNFEVSGCGSLTFKSTDIKGIISEMAAHICKLEAKIDPLCSVTYTNSCGSNCGDESITGSPQDAFSTLSSNYCQLSSDFNDFKNS